MTDTEKHDQAFRDYLEGNTDLSRHYQRLPVDEPKQATDRAILAAAQREVKPRRSTIRWFIPVAIAATLLLGIGLLFWRQAVTPPTTTNAAAPVPHTQLPGKVDRMLHDNPNADHWLEQILKLHQAGNSTEAAKEFQKFRQAYPAYTLDQQRFGVLKQYEKQ